MEKMRVGVIGAGAISDIYLENMIRRFGNLEVTGCASRTMESARRKAEKYGIAAMTVEEMLRDSSIEMIVNLTPPAAHFSLIKRALEAGKHVYTEKVLALNCAQANELAALADAKGLRLGSAPDTFLGAALQIAAEAVEDGTIGTVTGFAAMLNRDLGMVYEGLEFLIQPGGGFGYDLGIYYLTALMSILGPVAEVCGMVQTNRPQRTYRQPGHPKYGQTFEIRNENLMAAVIRMQNGALGTLLFNGDCIFPQRPFLTIQGTGGILYLPDPNQFGGDVRLLYANAQVEEILPCRHGFTENLRGLGAAEMAAAIREGRPHRASKEMACHALELLDGIVASSEAGTFYRMTTAFAKPAQLKGDETF